MTKNQQDVWNSIAGEWNRLRKKPMGEVADFLKDKKGKILDLGCGSGRHVINNPDIKFYGLDFSKEMIKFARENAKNKKINAKFSVSNSRKLPFENNFFDAAIYIAALHCISLEKEREKSLDELYRVLKKNSQALITVWSKNHIKLINHPKDATILWKKNTEELQRYYYLYDKDELSELLKKTGFEVVSINENEKNIDVVARKPDLF